MMLYVPILVFGLPAIFSWACLTVLGDFPPKNSELLERNTSRGGMLSKKICPQSSDRNMEGGGLAPLTTFSSYSVCFVVRKSTG